MSVPVKVLQFGEGNFLRAFVDYMIDEANQKGVFNGRVAIVKAIRYGSLDNFKNQNYRYTLVMRGILNGKRVNTHRIIDSIADAVGVYENYQEFLDYAKLESLRIVVSNTTEAGIACSENDGPDQCPPESYPAKLTRFLYARYQYFNGDAEKGLYLLPCELIENNGDRLKECVQKTIQSWRLPDSFLNWIDNCCVFCNTLVDRIVTGYPKNEAQEIEKTLGYSDKLLDVCEPFATWVIEDKKDVRRVFPLDQAGLPIIFVKDVLPYRQRKVRILNGAHTTTVLAGFLSGKKIVRDCVQDPVIGGYMKKCLFEEIIPTLPLEKENLIEFANSVLERFSNPYIDHSVLSIALNSVSKWKARVLCSLTDYREINHALPKYLVFSFSALLAFYMGSGINHAELYELRDDKEVLEFFDRYNALYAQNKITLNDYVRQIAGNTHFWDMNLCSIEGFSDLAVTYLQNILTSGAYAAMKELIES